jgi:N-acetylglucosamine-6-phosphate deacetylase
MVTILRADTVVTPQGPLGDRDVILDDGLVVDIAARRPSSPGDELIEVPEGSIVPGLVDIHVHGGDGHDTLDATPEAIGRMGRFMARHGVTSYLATTITAPREVIDAAVANAAAVMAAAVGGDPTGARLRGVHLEGPYLAAAQAGAQPLESLRAPVPAEYAGWFASGVVKRITVAPELDGMDRLLREAGAADVRVSIGHTEATSDTTRWAVEHGAHECTHLFSGMPGLHHRQPGVLSTCLADDRIVAEMIVDGVHIHPEIVRLLVQIKGPERLALVTDAIRAAGLGDGTYVLGGTRVEVRDGVTRRPHDGGLAGSTLTLDRALRNVMRYAGLTLAEALPMATTVPARVMGWESHTGTVEAGRDADIVILGPDLDVLVTVVAGITVHDGRDLTATRRREGGSRD